MADQLTFEGRTKANKIGMAILLIVTVVGLASILYSISVIANEAMSPANDAKGLATIFMSIASLVTIPITTIPLFFAVVMVLNLKIPNNRLSMQKSDLKSYVTKLIVAGITGILVGSALFLALVFSNTFPVPVEYRLFVSISTVAIIPVVVLVFIWSFIYLFRAHTSQIIMSNSQTRQF